MSYEQGIAVTFDGRGGSPEGNGDTPEEHNPRAELAKDIDFSMREHSRLTLMGGGFVPSQRRRDEPVTGEDAVKLLEILEEVAGEENKDAPSGLIEPIARAVLEGAERKVTMQAHYSPGNLHVDKEFQAQSLYGVFTPMQEEDTAIHYLDDDGRIHAEVAQMGIVLGGVSVSSQGDRAQRLRGVRLEDLHADTFHVLPGQSEYTVRKIEERLSGSGHYGVVAYTASGSEVRRLTSQLRRARDYIEKWR